MSDTKYPLPVRLAIIAGLSALSWAGIIFVAWKLWRMM